MKPLVMLLCFASFASADVISLQAWQQVGEDGISGYGLLGDVIYDPSDGEVTGGVLTGRTPVQHEAWMFWVDGGQFVPPTGLSLTGHGCLAEFCNPSGMMDMQYQDGHWIVDGDPINGVWDWGDNVEMTFTVPEPGSIWQWSIAIVMILGYIAWKDRQ